MRFPPSPETLIQDTAHLGILHTLLAAELARAATLPPPAPFRAARLQKAIGPFEAALRASNCPVIAEFKRASPSLGPFAIDADPHERLQAYAKGGAAAFSILAEPAFFQGRAEDFQAAAGLGRPVLYKGFVCTLAHLDEAVARSAQAVLLIARLLGPSLPGFIAAARLRGLEPLVEIHALDELATVRLARPRMVGWNARDLADFSMARGEVARLRAALPEVLLVRESGLHSPAEAEAALAEGFDALLIGEALMRHPDPAAFLAGIRGGR
jgi:indole-3-glycerol phosphate synthase